MANLHRSLTPEQTKVEIQHATAMAEDWIFKGNNAADRGEHATAERHYHRAQKWMDRMNVLLGNGDGS